MVTITIFKQDPERLKALIRDLRTVMTVVCELPLVIGGQWVKRLWVVR